MSCCTSRHSKAHMGSLFMASGFALVLKNLEPGVFGALIIRSTSQDLKISLIPCSLTLSFRHPKPRSHFPPPREALWSTVRWPELVVLKNTRSCRSVELSMFSLNASDTRLLRNSHNACLEDSRGSLFRLSCKIGRKMFSNSSGIAKTRSAMLSCGTTAAALYLREVPASARDDMSPRTSSAVAVLLLLTAESVCGSLAVLCMLDRLLAVFESKGMRPAWVAPCSCTMLPESAVARRLMRSQWQKSQSWSQVGKFVGALRRASRDSLQEAVRLLLSVAWLRREG